MHLLSEFCFSVYLSDIVIFFCDGEMRKQIH